MFQWFKAADLSQFVTLIFSAFRKEAWVRTPLLSTNAFVFAFFYFLVGLYRSYTMREVQRYDSSPTGATKRFRERRVWKAGHNMYCVCNKNNTTQSIRHWRYQGHLPDRQDENKS